MERTNRYVETSHRRYLFFTNRRSVVYHIDRESPSVSTCKATFSLAVMDASTKPADTLTATAFHEAGHAVMAVSLGRTIHKVTIKPGKSQFGEAHLGRCHLGDGRSKASKNELEDEILILFAGMVAEAHFTGSHSQLGAAEDLRVIRQLLCQRAGSQSQHERMYRRLLDKTEHLLSDDGHAKAIEMIAGELIAKTTISGRAVRHFFQQVVR